MLRFEKRNVLMLHFLKKKSFNNVRIEKRNVFRYYFEKCNALMFHF